MFGVDSRGRAHLTIGRFSTVKAEITLARQSAFVLAIRTSDVMPGSAQHAVKTGVDPQLGVGFELGSHSDVVAYAGRDPFS